MRNRDITKYQCPYAKRILSNGKRIECAGKTSDFIATGLAFEDVEGRRFWAQNFCKTVFCENCPVYILISDEEGMQ